MTLEDENGQRFFYPKLISKRRDDEVNILMFYLCIYMFLYTLNYLLFKFFNSL